MSLDIAIWGAAAIMCNQAVMLRLIRQTIAGQQLKIMCRLPNNIAFTSRTSLHGAGAVSKLLHCQKGYRFPIPVDAVIRNYYQTAGRQITKLTVGQKRRYGKKVLLFYLLQSFHGSFEESGKRHYFSVSSGNLEALGSNLFELLFSFRIYRDNIRIWKEKMSTY